MSRNSETNQWRMLYIIHDVALVHAYHHVLMDYYYTWQIIFGEVIRSKALSSNARQVSLVEKEL